MMVTAEPRMEELLASIRKAIHDDIGEVPASISSEASGSQNMGSMRELHVRVGEEPGAAAAEIQQLREKISRSRAADTPVRDVSSRSADLPAALAAETPRRSWRDLEPQPALRPTILDAEYIQQPPRRDYQRPQFEPPAEPTPYQGAQWHDSPPAGLPPPRDHRSRAEPGMMSGDASEAVHSAFNRLTENVLNRAAGDRSLEDLTREMLRGMLKQWLDDNLPQMVEHMVREEIERVARRGR
jgi:cell pole-organizing protein PopZ